ncbi:hypothetical protein Tco_1048873, partial [Tanacetum coccineum]
MSSPRNYGEKSHKSIIDPWRNTHSLSYLPPLSPNNSLPKSPPNSPIFDTTPLPTSPNSLNPTPSYLPPQISTQNHSMNHLHELLHLSNLLDINIQHAIESTNCSPPSSPFTHPPFLDQINFHSDFCHCCLVGKLSRYTSNPSTQYWQAIQKASKKQTCITGSTMESESISILADSDATLAKAYSQMYNGKSRHL